LTLSSSSKETLEITPKLPYRAVEKFSTCAANPYDSPPTRKMWKPQGMLSSELVYGDGLCEVHQTVVGPFENNVYILRCKETGDAVLIDAADEHDYLLELARKLDVRFVVETHGHHDHIQAVPAMREAGIDVAIAAGDAAMLPSYDLILDDDIALSVGRLSLRTIATPGHTPGSMCFSVLGTPLLFSGDTLFPGGPGNTKSDIGDFSTIIRSIDDRLFGAFDPETVVLPGHGLATTIGTERPQLDEWVARGW
jgi:glyoxylase-like metal-dependent hydrolase (beta-lactamase superfamily II)